MRIACLVVCSTVAIDCIHERVIRGQDGILKKEMPIGDAEISGKGITHLR
jgi:hypothetical protein